MYNYYFVKYKDEEGTVQTFIDKEVSLIKTKDLAQDMKQELKKRGVEYPVFAIEEISEEQFNYLKRKGIFNIGAD